ncbi:Rid family detoxifying hydrolase [Candidatus Saccharibacteria bacterium]|nr:Rid family detoxifying hydrolase [Candidatus Saccharibacteria bacterium]
MKKQVFTDKAPSANHILSQAVESNGFIFVSGQIHQSPDGSLMNGSVSEKLDRIFSNISAILESAGSGLKNIVKVTIYVTDMSQMPELNEKYPTYFDSILPAREAVCVKELPLGATIEISVIAENN